MKTSIKPKSPEKIAQEMEEARALTVAQERLQKRREMAGPVIHEIEYEGEKWYVKCLDFTGVSLAAMLIIRDEKKKIQLFNRKVLKSVIIAALHCGVASDPNDPESSYFSQQDAKDYAEAPSEKGLVAVLFNKVIELNPELLPKKA